MPIYNTQLPWFAPWLPGGQSGTYESRADRYHWLTSPVAYITGPIKDPFISETGSDPDKALLIIWAAPAWHYAVVAGGASNFHQLFREQQWAKNMIPAGTLEQQREALKSMWVAFSFGPDRVADRLAPSFAAFGIQDYDPTNGTISRGDVIRHRE